jgi:hypothetical protein
MELFKYVVPARIDVFQNQRIRFTQPAEFNDPWEALPKFDALFKQESIDRLKYEIFREGRQGKYDEMFDKEIEKMKQRFKISLNSQTIEAIRREFHTSCVPSIEDRTANIADTALGLKAPELRYQLNKTIYEKLNAIVGILSLSEIPDGLLMWSHYTDSHKGFVIGFDSTNKFFDQRKSSDDPIRRVMQVSYSKERPSFTGFSKKPDESEQIKFANHMIMTKADVWAYEREWRMLQTLDSADEKIEEKSTVYLYRIPPKCVTSIILGCRMSFNDETSIRNILMTQEFTHVRLFKAEQDRNDYRLNLIEAK